LNEFLVLEKHLSFSKAAQELSITQSALSRHIQMLEEEFGVPLFQRSTQKIKLTPYGEALVPHANAILEHCRSFSKTAADMRSSIPNRISIGSCGFPNYYGITDFLAGFKSKYPQAVINVRIGSTDECVRWLRDDKIDAAFVHNVADFSREFHAVPFCGDHMSAALPAGHPLAGRRTIELRELKDETFYLRSVKDTLMDRMEVRILKDAGFEPKLSPNRGTWADSVINRGSEVSLVMQGLAEKLRGNLHLWVADIVPSIPTDVYLISPKDGRPTELLNFLVRLARDRARL